MHIRLRSPDKSLSDVTWTLKHIRSKLSKNSSSLMPATYAQETCAWNLCKSSCTKLARVLVVSLVQVFLVTSFLHVIEHCSIPAQKLSGMWQEPGNVIGQPVVVQETVMNLRQIFHANFLHKFLVQVSWACVAGMREIQLPVRVSSKNYVAFIVVLHSLSLLHDLNTSPCSTNWTPVENVLELWARV